MNGRYLIYTPVESAPDEKRFDAAWRRFAEICRSLNRDGLDYSVQLNLSHLTPHVLVIASGTPKPRRQPARRGLVLPSPIPPQHCRERAQGYARQSSRGNRTKDRNHYPVRNTKFRKRDSLGSI